MRPAVGLLLFYKEKSEENENMKNYKIAVAGTGYVGLSLSVLLAQHNQVMAVDIVQAKVDMICNIRRKFVAILAESDNFQFVGKEHLSLICWQRRKKMILS